MSNYYTYPEEIIELKKNNPDENVFVYDLEKMRQNKNTQHPTHYIPILIKRLKGKPTRLNLKWTDQVIMANAKIPYGTTEETASDVRITYKKLNEEDLEASEYSAGSKKILLEKNAIFIQAMSIIHNDYLALITQLLGEKNTTIKRAKKNDISSFCQTHRNAKEDEESDENGKVPLERAFYRFKVKKSYDSDYFERNTKSGKVPIIYDARKKEGKRYKRAVYKYKKNGKIKKEPLTVKNAGKFLTYLSLTSGCNSFDSICISSKNISLSGSVSELIACPHKKIKMDTLTSEEMEQSEALFTSGYNSEEEEESESDSDFEVKKAKVNVRKKKSKKSKKRSKTPEPESDSEPEPESEPEESDSEPEPESEPEESDSEPEPESESSSDEEAPKKKGKSLKRK